MSRACYRFTEEEKREIIKEYQQGKSAVTIADLRGTCYKTVQRVIRRSFGEWQSVYQRKAKPIADIKADWNRNIDINMIAVKYGFKSVKQLCEWVSERRSQGYDFKLRRNGRKKRATKNNPVYTQ